MRGRAGLLAAVLGTALVPGLVAAQEDATPTPTETAAPTETPTSVFGQAPQPPRGMHLKVDWDGTRRTVVVTWDPSPGAESYSIERAEIDGPWQQPVYAVVATVEQSEKPTFRDPNSDGPVGYYCYRITAIGRGSTSDPSGDCVMIALVERPGFPGTPGAPNTGSGVAPNDGGQPASSLFAGFGVLLVAGTAGLWASLRRR